MPNTLTNLTTGKSSLSGENAIIKRGVPDYTRENTLDSYNGNAAIKWNIDMPAGYEGYVEIAQTAGTPVSNNVFLRSVLDDAFPGHRTGRQSSHPNEFKLQGLIDPEGNFDIQLAKIPAAFQSLVPFDLMKINVENRKDKKIDEYSFVNTGNDVYQILRNQELYALMDNLAYNKYRPKLSDHLKAGYQNQVDYKRSLLDDVWEKHLSDHFKLRSKLFLPIKSAKGESGVLSFYSHQSDQYTQTHLNRLKEIAPCYDWLLDSLRSKLKVASRDHAENSRLKIDVARNEKKHAAGFGGIVGNSPCLQEVFGHIELVSPTPVAVLICGESGTGKEMVARSIHQLSPRKANPLVIINCAAIPADLVESELFGHEKGSFTGASDRRIGKFEMANGGTIFLDEIGDLPLESQVKLLRVLQEKEFERIGGNKTIRVDVRIIAATNKDLEKEVAEGHFRLDLFYRLNVFPIELPPLRARKDDIPLLAKHFVEKIATKLNRDATGFSATAMNQLVSYDWPGNIRELEHLLERSYLLANGHLINEIKLPTAKRYPEANTLFKKNIPLKTLDEMEADHITDVLRNCQGKISGINGAATILGLPPSTLQSKLKRLGITKGFY